MIAVRTATGPGRYCLAALLGLALCCYTGLALAADWLRLSPQGLSAAEQAMARQSLLRVADRLPPLMQAALATDGVRVSWGELPAQVYGRTLRIDHVQLNRSLVQALAGAADTAGQRRLQHALDATLIHELAHLYDRRQNGSPGQRALLLRCSRQAKATGLVGLADECRGQHERRYTLSDDPQLLDLAGWLPMAGQRGRRQAHSAQHVRSPDEYELSRPQEFVAVNLEYFLLDPEYACRRPALQRFFAEHFQWAPEGAGACEAALPYLEAGSDFAHSPLSRLDPERVQGIDYLLAEPNQEWASRWGHSMLRLIVCAPGRPRGEDCRLDLEHHLVLSFRAFVGDVQLSSWDGLVGAYPSRLFILPLAQVLEEYTKTELRGLSSIPLLLSDAERTQVVQQAIQLHWEYDGTYYFLANNCAVETLNLLRSGSGRADLQGLDSIMPNGLLRLLQARGLADSGVLDNPAEALRLGYRFDSFRERYQAVFLLAKRQLGLPVASVEQWLGLAASQRRDWFEQADFKTAAALLLLEEAALRQRLLVVRDQLKQRYMQPSPSDEPGLEAVAEVLRNLLGQTVFLSRPGELLDAGYGLPLAQDWQSLQRESDQRQQALLALRQSLTETLKALLPEAIADELQATQANLERLGRQLREGHRQSGGVMLP